MTPFAIYFPQFYPIETNDAVWGKGFTDWALLANANMRNQWPRRAPQRGYYDGSSPRVHIEQMEEARGAGLGGFGVYHYWFYGRRELDAFERTRLEHPEASSFPWFLIWATEGWSRRWLGDPTEIVHLSSEPDRNAIELHCDYLARCFESESYFRMGVRPLFVWYNLGHFAKPAALVDMYRKCWQARGLDPYTMHFVKKPFDTLLCSLVDGSYLFEPRLYFSFQRPGKSVAAKRVKDALSRALGDRFIARLLVLMDSAASRGTAYSAADFLKYLESAERKSLIAGMQGEVQEVVSPGWNNAPRYGGRFTALEDLPVDLFSKIVARAVAGAKVPALVNAWNEWSEGAAIEPCAYLGRRYLDALRPVST
jgi:hypothetical protein